MFLIYRPDGNEEQRWPFEPGRLRSMETEAIEKRTGWDYGSDFVMHLQKGSALARRALLWTFLRREHPRLKFEDVDFAHDELELVYDQAELAELADNLEKAPFDSEAERVAALASIREAMAAAPEAPGKAPAKSGASSTSGRSPSSSTSG